MEIIEWMDDGIKSKAAWIFSTIIVQLLRAKEKCAWKHHIK